MHAPHGQSTRLPQASTSPARGTLRAAAVAPAASKFPRAKGFCVDRGGVEDGAVGARGEMTRAVFVVRGVVVERRGGSRVPPGGVPRRGVPHREHAVAAHGGDEGDFGFRVRVRGVAGGGCGGARRRRDGEESPHGSRVGAGGEAEDGEEGVSVASASPGELGERGVGLGVGPAVSEGAGGEVPRPQASVGHAGERGVARRGERHGEASTAPSARRTASRVARVLAAAAAAREAWDRALGWAWAWSRSSSPRRHTRTCATPGADGHAPPAAIFVPSRDTASANTSNASGLCSWPHSRRRPAWRKSRASRPCEARPTSPPPSPDMTTRARTRPSLWEARGAMDFG